MDVDRPGGANLCNLMKFRGNIPFSRLAYLPTGFVKIPVIG